MSQTPAQNAIFYRCMPEGRGATLTFKQPLIHRPSEHEESINPEQLSHVGTVGCIFCVGLYLPLKKEHGSDVSRCFLAHIYASMLDRQARRYRCIPEAAGQSIKRQMVAQLEKEADTAGWSKDDVDIDRMLNVCPLYEVDPAREAGSKYAEKGGRMSGYWVVQGVKEFLGVPADPVVDTEAEGFVVDHGGNGLAVRVLTGVPERERVKGWYEGCGEDKMQYWKSLEDAPKRWVIHHMVMEEDVEND